MASDRLGLGRNIYDYFVSKGMAPHQAAAVAGNMVWEGEGRTDAVAVGDNYKHSPNAPHSIGIGQWNDRSPALVAFAKANGVDIPDGDLRDPKYAADVAKRIPLQTQLDFAYSEMQGPEKRAYQNITNAPDLTTANAGAIGYHRPAGWTQADPYAGSGFSGRQALAEQILKQGPGQGQPYDMYGEDARKPYVSPDQTQSVQVASAAPKPPSSLLGSLFPSQESPDAQQPSGGALQGASMRDLDYAQKVNDRATQPDAFQSLGGGPRLNPEALQRLRAMLSRKSQLGIA